MVNSLIHKNVKYQIQKSKIQGNIVTNKISIIIVSTNIIQLLRST